MDLFKELLVLVAQKTASEQSYGLFQQPKGRSVTQVILHCVWQSDAFSSFNHTIMDSLGPEGDSRSQSVTTIQKDIIMSDAYQMTQMEILPTAKA